MPLRTAARSLESGDFSARVSLSYNSPPEVRETKLAFNHMADHVSRLVAALEREHDELLVEKERLRVTIESLQHNRVVGLDSHTVIRRQDGVTIAISDTAAPIRSSDGKMQGGGWCSRMKASGAA